MRHSEQGPITVGGYLNGSPPDFALGSHWQADMAATIAREALDTGLVVEEAVLDWFQREDRWPVQDAIFHTRPQGEGYLLLLLDFFQLPEDLDRTGRPEL